MTSVSYRPKIAIVGGGLAGMAAAVGLADDALEVHLFESRRKLGGRAASYLDPTIGELIDHCQHVSMGCCTNMTDFCRRTGIEEHFSRDSRINFVAPDGKCCVVQANPVLPAPLHLLPSLWGLRYLRFHERLRIISSVWKLATTGMRANHERSYFFDWLRKERQSKNCVELFWKPILVSALGESLERVSVAAARKVVVDGFLASRDGYVVVVPDQPLSRLFDQYVGEWLTSHGIAVRRETPVTSLRIHDGNVDGVHLADGAAEPFDFVVLALTWRQISNHLTPELTSRLPELASAAKLMPSPITGVHLWLDRPLMDRPHAVLLDRCSQWVFQPKLGASSSEHYYQVVISASHDLENLHRSEIADKVCEELNATWPAEPPAKLLRWRVVIERVAVFSPAPDSIRLRPSQRTRIPNLLLAGDWTATGWPSTMESAVRSGYLAAESVWERLGIRRRLLVSSLPRSWLAQRLLGKAEI